MDDLKTINLYNTKIYKVEKRFNNGDSQTERLFALANAVYILSKECVYLNSSDPFKAQLVVSDDEHPIIDRILEEAPDVLGVLQDIKGTNESSKTSTIDIAIMVCEAHLNRQKTR